MIRPNRRLSEREWWEQDPQMGHFLAGLIVGMLMIVGVLLVFIFCSP